MTYEKSGSLISYPTSSTEMVYFSGCTALATVVSGAGDQEREKPSELTDVTEISTGRPGSKAEFAN